MPNILIIEDEKSLRYILCVALENDYTVKTAGNGREALAVLDRWKADLVITDYAMPGMTGIELIEYIVGNGRDRSLHKNTPPKIIVLSAMLDGALEKRALAAGADVCMRKPFDLETLRAKIVKALKA
ncbi:response regulator [bacterium]|nr:response regulator [bacterium]